jgi:dihydroorotase
MTEVGDLVDAGAVAVSDDGRPVADAGLVRRLLEYLRLFDVPFVQHAEDLSLSAAGVMHEGTVSTRLGLRGIPAAAEEVVLARDLLLAERTGGRYHAAHVSTARGAELIAEARHRGARATAEVTPHHLLLDHEAVSAYDTNAKVNPPLRTPEDREALVAALAGGTIDAVATDHAPHHADEKDRPFPEAPFGIVGLETAFALLHTELVLRGRLRLEQLVERMSTGPARIFRLPGGTLAPGGAADVTVLDLDEEWTVQPERFLGLSRNTPFAGRRVRGRACLTIVGGHVVWARERAAGTGEGSGTARVEGDPGAGDGRREGSPARAARDRSRGSAGARRRAASTSGGA